MHLVAITRVRNEADIIEPFIRHTCEHFDEVIVQDHDSTDETPAILTALREEGLSVHVRGTESRNTQGFDMTVMMRDAFRRGADWVVPLDADEFVETATGTTLRDMLKLRADEPLNVFWNNFAVCSDTPIGARNPVVAMRSRNTRPSHLAKVFIPRRSGTEPGATIYEGSHFLTRKGQFLPARDVSDIVLCHYPIRSIEQYSYKVAIGMFRYVVNPSEDKHSWGWHYETAFKHLMAGNVEGLREAMQQSALCYSDEHPQSPQVAERALRYLGGDLCHQARVMTSGDVLSGVLAYTRDMAIELHRHKKKRSILRSFFGREQS